MLNLEQTCNNPHLHSLARTVIRTRLSVWACQPFCCQRTFNPSLSECPECLRARLAGLTRSLCAILPSSSAPVLPGILLGVLVALRLVFEIPCGTSPHSSLATKSLPQNKKPGVERRVQPPTPEWLHALLDFFLPCTRKEPHYRIYFLPSLYFELEDYLRSDCDAPEQPSAHQNLRTTRNDTSFSYFVKPCKQLFFLKGRLSVQIPWSNTVNETITKAYGES
jgi:hypothetical protein